MLTVPLFSYLPVVRCTVSSVFALAHCPAAALEVYLGVVPHYDKLCPVYKGPQASLSVDLAPSEPLPGPMTSRIHCCLGSLESQVHADTQVLYFHSYLKTTGHQIP